MGSTKPRSSGAYHQRSDLASADPSERRTDGPTPPPPSGQPNDRTARPLRRAPAWTWLVPLVGGLGVFSLVLATTPPGFGALSDVLFSIPRGPFAAATAYALGAAGSLGLLSLLVLTAACSALRFLLHCQDGCGL